MPPLPLRLCELGAPTESQPHQMSYNSLHSHIAMIDSQIPHTKMKTAKYNPLIQTLRIIGWQVNPLITITAGVRGALHELSIKDSE